MADKWQLKAVISANAESMLKTLKGVNRMARTTRKHLADVASSAGNLSGRIGLPFAVLGGALAGFSLLAVKRAVVDFTDLGEAIQNGAIKAGMSVEEYQRWAYVAEQSSASAEALTTNVASLNRRVGEAAVGKNKALAGMLGRLGISMRDANGQVRSGVELLPELADAFRRNESPVLRARMGMAGFGKAYADILPMLVEGSEGIRDNLARFDRIADILGPDDVRAAKDLGDSFKDLGLVMKGFHRVVARELAPVIRPLVDGLVAWWVANRNLVASEVSKVAKEFAAYIKTIDWAALAKGVGEFFSGLARLIESIGGAKNALIALVVFMNLSALVAFGSLIGSVGRLTWALGTMAVSAIPQAALASTGLATALGTASTAGLALLAILGKLALAAAVGYGIGTLWNDYVLSPAISKLAGREESLGTWLHGLVNKEPDMRAPMPTSKRPSLLGAPQQVKAGGEIKVTFDNAPPGMRFDQTNYGDFGLDVGRRGSAVGSW